MANPETKPGESPSQLEELKEPGEQGEQDELIVLARIGKVHGIKGWLKLNSYTSPPENIQKYQSFWTRKNQQQQWRQLEVTGIKLQGNGLVAHFKGFHDPESASVLSGQELAVRRNLLPGLDQGDFYWYQLEGLLVVNLQDQVYGRVAKIIETGANDVLVIKPTAESLDDRERLIPYLLETVVHTVDLDTQIIVVDWDADYLQ